MARLNFRFNTNIPGWDDEDYDNGDTEGMAFSDPSGITFRMQDGTRVSVSCCGDGGGGATDGVCEGSWDGLDIKVDGPNGETLLDYPESEDDESGSAYEWLQKLGEPGVKIESFEFYCPDFEDYEGPAPTCSDLEVSVEYTDESGEDVELEFEAEGDVKVEIES